MRIWRRISFSLCFKTEHWTSVEQDQKDPFPADTAAAGPRRGQGHRLAAPTTWEQENRQYRDAGITILQVVPDSLGQSWTTITIRASPAMVLPGRRAPAGGRSGGQHPASAQDGSPARAGRGSGRLKQSSPPNHWHGET